MADRQDAAGTADHLLCYCHGVSSDDVRRHFARPGATYESLIDETRIATKCTACRLDLDLLLSELHAGPAGPLPGPTVDDQDQPSRWSRPQDLSDAGFVQVAGEVTTLVRIANRGLFFDDTSKVVPYDWTLRVFSDAGRVVARRSGSLPVGTDLEVDFADLVAAPFAGWFLVCLYPRGRGLLGTTRPQIVVRGAGWASSVHTQFLSMACRHKAALLFSNAGRTGAIISLINASRAANTVTITLSGPAGDPLTRTIDLPGYGARLADIDDLFGRLAADGIYLVAVQSRDPVCKHLILRNDDGSWSQNHFPNAK